jgi:hypothetical protein
MPGELADLGHPAIHYRTGAYVMAVGGAGLLLGMFLLKPGEARRITIYISGAVFGMGLSTLALTVLGVKE